MSNIDHRYRLILADLKEDKLVVDELVDCIVGAIGRETEDANADVQNLLISACRPSIIVFTIEGAEKAAEMAKKEVIRSLTKKEGIDFLENLLKEEDDEH